MPGFRIGYVLAGEDHPASSLVKSGLQAERSGFDFLFVSDHFHPWNRSQGCSSFVWSVLGALSHATCSIQLYSAVSCPGDRLHLTTLAQAAATIAELSAGRFTLGLGTGENLNEHVTGAPWPRFDERLARLEEAVPFLEELLSGDEVSRTGDFFTVDRAQLFGSSTESLMAIASSGPRSARLAARLDKDLISLGADAEVVEAYKAAGGKGRKLSQISVCWGNDEKEATALAHRLWPEVALAGTLFATLATPSEFEAATREISREDVAASIVCGSDPSLYLEAILECKRAGFDGVALHSIGPDPSGFFQFWETTLKPNLQGV